MQKSLAYAPLVSLHSALAEGETVPSWVQLVPAGTFSANDGRGPWVLADAAAVIARSLPKPGAKLPIDENHATDLSAKMGFSAPARGWIVEMQARPDGIWGRVEWTDAGRALLADKAYFGISPVLALEPAKSGASRVLKVLRASLTNDPALDELAHLYHRGSEMDLTSKVRTALNLAEDVGEDGILSAIKDLYSKAEKSGTGDELVGRFAKAAGLDAALTAEALEEALQAKAKAAADKVDAAVVTQLQSQLATLQASVARKEAVAAIDAAITAGKPIKPLRDHYIERHMKDPKSVDKELAALASIHDGGVKPEKHKAPEAIEGLSAVEIHQKAVALSKEKNISHTDAVLQLAGRR